MCNQKCSVAGLLIAGLVCLFLPAVGALAASEDKSLSPYFKVISENSGAVEALPLQRTSAEVDIAGVIADVRITQVYRNRGTQPIEAIYVFPGSTRAAVYAMRMTIGERVVLAKIKERQTAIAEYKKAKQQGKRASLLEQQRPNVFQMNVANVMPGDTVVVELSYTELLVAEDGMYEFVYPTVVGPRYSETPVASAPDSERWIANPFLREASPTPYSFDINVDLATGVPIQALISPSHPVDIEYFEKNSARIKLKQGESNSGDRDYILRYRLQGDEVASGLLLHRGDKENFFLLMSQPPKRVVAKQIPPREYIFVVDVSGSMHGFPLDTSKELMRELLSGLRMSDSFNILFFSGGNQVLAESSLKVTPENIQHAIKMMENQKGGGGTRLLPALKQAMSMPVLDGTARSFVVVSDGYVSVEADALEYVRANLNRANFFSFGIGSSVNRFLMEGLARAGRGEPVIITSPSEAATAARKFRHYIETPVLTGIEVDFEGFNVYDVEPKSAPDLFAQRPLVMFGKWRGAAAGQIKISGYRGEGHYIKTVDVVDAPSPVSTQALRYLWARQRITDLGDFEKLSPDSERKAKITSLGLTYNLLTAYTSFIAVDEVIANPNGQNRSVKQALPLPEGVSELAVGGVVATAPEPEMFGLLSVLGLMLLWSLWSRNRRKPCTYGSVG